jgi:hypothetical protein
MVNPFPATKPFTPQDKKCMKIRELEDIELGNVEKQVLLPIKSIFRATLVP